MEGMWVGEKMLYCILWSLWFSSGLVQCSTVECSIVRCCHLLNKGFLHLHLPKNNFDIDTNNHVENWHRSLKKIILCATSPVSVPMFWCTVYMTWRYLISWLILPELSICFSPVYCRRLKRSENVWHTTFLVKGPKKAINRKVE